MVLGELCKLIAATCVELELDKRAGSTWVEVCVCAASCEVRAIHLLRSLVKEGIKVRDFIRKWLELCDILRENLGAGLATGTRQSFERRRQEGVSCLCSILVSAIEHFA